jgi:hypothetical protein
MQHITPERIAALADEPATLEERAHLEACADCVAGLTAAQRLIRMAVTDIPAIGRPVSSWDRLGPALRAEGLVRRPLDGADDDARFSLTGSHGWRRAVQLAAGVFLAVGGAVVGRASAGLPGNEPAFAQATDTAFTSTSDALQVLDRATTSYQRAVAYLAANDSSVTLSGRDAAELYQTRLDALDRAATVTRAALYRAPDDPVLNQYYLSTMGARDLTLRQMGEVLPVSSSGRVRY